MPWHRTTPYSQRLCGVAMDALPYHVSRSGKPPLARYTAWHGLLAGERAANDGPSEILGVFESAADARAACEAHLKSKTEATIDG